MTTTSNNRPLTDLGLTELETSFIGWLIKALYAEPGFTDVDIKDMAEYMKISVPSAKGVLGSLVKKGIVQTERYDANFRVQEFISLHGEYYYLHPEWKDSE